MNFEKLKPANHYASELDELHELRDDSFELAESLFLMAQKEAWNEALKFAAENAKMRFWDGHFNEGKALKHFQSGINNLTVSKESILQHLVE